MSDNQKGTAPLMVLISLVFVLGFLAILASEEFNKFSNKQIAYAQTSPTWAFEETFNYGAPTSPSQSLLPKTFDYVATHRTHPDHPDGIAAGGSFGSFPGDHADDCSFDGTTLQHTVTQTTHRSNTSSPDQSFFICNNHMMSSMGEVEGYSVTSFWPRQEFDFNGGGTLEFDVDLSLQSRNWYEVIITPRDQFKIAPAIASLPISEGYPKDRIVLRYGSPANGSGRQIVVANTLPTGMEDNDRNVAGDWRTWGEAYPTDTAFTDRRIRRKNQVTISENQIVWGIQKADGTFDNLTLAVPQGLPLHRGLVEFKTHAYTPNKDELHKRHTFHWDNIRFSGPKLAPYESFEDNTVINLEGNGSVPIGSTKTVSINLPYIGSNPILMGQTHQGMSGQVQLSINGGTNIAISPISANPGSDSCYFGGDWATFHMPINPSQLKVGANTFKWTVGPRPACAQGQWYWDGFAIKGLEVQFDTAAIASTHPTPTTSVAKPGDIDGNGNVNIFDYNILLTNFNKTGTGIQGDLNNSGKVDIFDYNILLTNFGK